MSVHGSTPSRTERVTDEPCRRGERLVRNGRGRIYSGERCYRVDVLEYDAEENRVRLRFDSTLRVDWYPLGWVYG